MRFSIHDPTVETVGYKNAVVRVLRTMALSEVINSRWLVPRHDKEKALYKSLFTH